MGITIAGRATILKQHWNAKPSCRIQMGADIGNSGAQGSFSSSQAPSQWKALVAITVDLHESDRPCDIEYAADCLAARRIPGTFFVPSTMLIDPKYEKCLRLLPQLGHEVGSHGHLHDRNEISALVTGSGRALAFLRTSKALYEDFFGEAPTSFRSPAWCKLGGPAIDELHALSYRVDSSSTPGRWRILTSFPYQPTWPRWPRNPWFLRPGLLEIPTSTLLVPAGSPTFVTLRRSLAVLLVKALTAESCWYRNRAVVLQFHPDDFNPESHDRLRPKLRLGDFVLSEAGGFGFKHALRATRSRSIAGMTHAILDATLAHRYCSLIEISADQA